jgi:hypothetical protein
LFPLQTGRERLSRYLLMKHLTHVHQVRQTHAQRNNSARSTTFVQLCRKPQDSERKKCIGHETRVPFLSAVSARNIFRSDKHLASYVRDARAETRVGLHVTCPVSSSDFKRN